MNDDTRRIHPDAGRDRRGDRPEGPPPYQPPRIVKKRAVSKATLFTGSGPDTGGVISGG